MTCPSGPTGIPSDELFAFGVENAWLSPVVDDSPEVPEPNGLALLPDEEPRPDRRRPLELPALEVPAVVAGSVCEPEFKLELAEVEVELAATKAGTVISISSRLNF